MSNALFGISIAIYSVALAVYLAFVFKRRESLRHAARLALGTAVVAHLASIGSLCIVGYHPLRDSGGVLNLSGLVLSVAYVVGSFRWRLGVLGAVVSLSAAAFVVASWLWRAEIPLTGESSLLRELHLSLVAVGTGIFALATAVSLLYLRRESALKSGRIPGPGRRGPAITTLDRLNHWMVLCGFPIYTLVVVTGVAWASRETGLEFRLEYIIAGLIWLTFAFSIGARLTVGLRGRKAALVTIAGFLATTLVLAIYVIRRILA